MITSKEEYDAAVKAGRQPLMEWELAPRIRREIQEMFFGKGHGPQTNARFYRWCWEHRPHLCEECGRPLRGYSAVYVSHILSRGAYPEMAHDARNVNILCHACHSTWENGNREGMRIYPKNEKTISKLKKEYLGYE